MIKEYNISAGGAEMLEELVQLAGNADIDETYIEETMAMDASIKLKKSANGHRRYRFVNKVVQQKITKEADTIASERRVKRTVVLTANWNTQYRADGGAQPTIPEQATIGESSSISEAEQSTVAGTAANAANTNATTAATAANTNATTAENSVNTTTTTEVSNAANTATATATANAPNKPREITAANFANTRTSERGGTWVPRDREGNAGSHPKEPARTTQNTREPRSGLVLEEDEKIWSDLQGARISIREYMPSQGCRRHPR